MAFTNEEMELMKGEDGEIWGGWNGLRMNLDFDTDESGSELSIEFDHKEYKGEGRVEFKELLDGYLTDLTDTSDDEVYDETVIPQLTALKAYLEECLAMVSDKLEEANDFVNND